MVHGVDVAGVSVPALGLGTWQLAGDSCTRVVADALAMGYRHVDTAQRYGNEAEVGRALRSSAVARDEIFLATKLDFGNTRGDVVRPSVEASLRRLGTDYVDLLLIHYPEPEVALEETLAAMAELRAAGLVRHLGVSNFPPSLLTRACAATRIVTDQVEYHPYLSQRELLGLCHDRDLILTAYAPLARGRVLDDPEILDIARAHGRSPAQIALRWLLHQDRVAAIPKASSPDRLRENAAVLEFRLTPEEMARIAALDDGSRLVDPPHAPDWER